ncbi:Malectin-like domain [Arabidopsis suecica]|uniref:Malectin-like domain n=1 Tax=Arabidopsis suecica TaxID=45249 RepID=A0A8T2HCV0_ARASU|nr:Malectin-like domain [Arabidopsis suecica]
MERHCVFVTIFVLILHLVQAQNQTGFISVDCGLSPPESPYNAPQTGLTYTSDTGLINTGKTGRIAKDFEPFVDKPALTMRYFPDGIRNCYNLNVTRDTNYLIKATFVYGNYDGLNVDPNFDLYFGPNLWTTICLVKTGISIPFINVLELRPLKKNVYATQSGSLKYLFRMYVSNSSRRIR